MHICFSAKTTCDTQIVKSIPPNPHVVLREKHIYVSKHTFAFVVKHIFGFQNAHLDLFNLNNVGFKQIMWVLS